MIETLTIERLHQVMDYNPETGTFKRLLKTSNRANLEKEASFVAGNGRKYVNVDGKAYLAHRLAWFYITGSWPSQNVASLDGDYLNVRFSNLKEESFSETSSKNGYRSTNTSGIKGVSWDKSKNKWLAYKTQDYKLVHLGRFDTKEEAAKAVAEAGVIQVNPEERKRNAQKVKVRARQKQLWSKILDRSGKVTSWPSYEAFCESIGHEFPLHQEVVAIDVTKPIGPGNFQWSDPIFKRFNTNSREGKIAYSRQHRKDNPNLYRDKHLKKKFGVDLLEYQRMLDNQGGVCDICKQPETAIRQGKLQPLSVDHDHTTGKVRGLLCVSCNTGIGKFRDDISLLSSAIAYLTKHKKVKQ